jgi:hypothetical protein
MRDAARCSWAKGTGTGTLPSTIPACTPKRCLPGASSFPSAACGTGTGAAASRNSSAISCTNVSQRWARARRSWTPPAVASHSVSSYPPWLTTISGRTERTSPTRSAPAACSIQRLAAASSGQLDGASHSTGNGSSARALRPTSRASSRIVSRRRARIERAMMEQRRRPGQAPNVAILHPGTTAALTDDEHDQAGHGPPSSLGTRFGHRREVRAQLAEYVIARDRGTKLVDAKHICGQGQ